MKYKCWCEWLEEAHRQLHLPGKQRVEHYWSKRDEDLRHHAYLEGAKLPTVRELDDLLVQWIFRVPRAGSGDIARAILTLLEARHE